MKREIIKINEEKCNGCGLCSQACAEGAIQIINGKAKLVKDEYCDGLGACIGECPEDAIEIIEREAKPFNEEAVEEHLKKNGLPRRSAPRNDDKSAKEPCACPSSQPKAWKANSKIEIRNSKLISHLTNWPIQLKLVPIKAEYFNGADLLLSADCAPFADSDFHHNLLAGRKLIIGCPKLDDADFYIEKLTEILKNNDVKSLTVAHMEVPCCSGLIHIAKKAIEHSGKEIPLETIEIRIRS